MTLIPKIFNTQKIDYLMRGDFLFGGAILRVIEKIRENCLTIPLLRLEHFPKQTHFIIQPSLPDTEESAPHWGKALQNWIEEIDPDNAEYKSRIDVVERITNCFAHPDRSFLNLEYLNLSSLKGVVFPSTISWIHLGYNQLTSLDGVDFPKQLKYLFLNNNSITTLEGAVFPSSLYKLNLSNNLLTKIKSGTFPDSIKELNLENNQIIHLDTRCLPRSLIRLDDSNVRFDEPYPSQASLAPKNQIRIDESLVLPRKTRVAHEGSTHLKAKPIPPADYPDYIWITKMWTYHSEKRRTQAKSANEKTLFNNCKKVGRWIGTALKKYKLSPSHSLYVCETPDGIIQGMMVCQIEKDSDKVYIEYLVTNPKNIQCSSNEQPIRGAGTCLLQTAEKIAIAYNKSRVMLYPLDSAINFYKNYGFTYIVTHTGVQGPEMELAVRKISSQITPLLAA